MRDYAVGIVTWLVLWFFMGFLWARMGYKFPTTMNRKALIGAARLHWYAIPGVALMYPWVRLGNMIEARVHR